MRKLATDEGVVGNGQVTLSPDADIPDKTRVYVIVLDTNARRTPRIYSPRLAHPEQASYFLKEVIEEARRTDG